MQDTQGIIDVHHHVIPQEYIESLKEIGINSSLGRNLPHWDVGETLRVMDKNGVATSFVSISAPGVYFREAKDPQDFAIRLSRQMNEICADLVRDHPARFGAFAILPLPDVDAALSELKYALEVLHLDGVTLLSNYDGYYLGDPRFDRLLAELNRRKAVVFVHPMTPPGMEAIHLGFPEMMMDVCFDTTRTAYSLVLSGQTEKYPDIRFILSHAGGTVPYIVARVKGAAMFCQLGKTIPKGLEYYLQRFYYDTALSAAPCALSSLHALVDSSRILFGSDYIFATDVAFERGRKGIREYGRFTGEDIAAIECGNTRALFPGKITE
ncbi:MAG: amidohydrolase [Methanoregula sp.]|jgi:predicted TIM-barrel fold metal-dependent hydrolase|nr:amidohydrolase [Methanoregula sp.]